MLNQKGGVGKTSTTHHLAGTLAQLGRRVLLVDNDPQASLTQGLLGPDATRQLAPAATVAAVHDGGDPYPEQVLLATPVSGVTLLPGSKAATRFNVPVPEEAPYERQVALRDWLAGVAGGFDLVLIDCPPNLHLCSWSALVASDGLVVPLQAEDYGAQGIAEVQESVDLVRALANPDLRTIGYLITMYSPRLAIHQLYAGRLREMYGPLVFDTTVPISTDYKEAIANRMPVAGWKPRSAAAKAVKGLAAEFEARVAAAYLQKGAA
jgi:chromosome partitioning protein